MTGTKMVKKKKPAMELRHAALHCTAPRRWPHAQKHRHHRRMSTDTLVATDDNKHDCSRKAYVLLCSILHVVIPYLI